MNKKLVPLCLIIMTVLLGCMTHMLTVRHNREQAVVAAAQAVEKRQTQERAVAREIYALSNEAVTLLAAAKGEMSTGPLAQAPDIARLLEIRERIEQHATAQREVNDDLADALTGIASAISRANAADLLAYLDIIMVRAIPGYIGKN